MLGGSTGKWAELVQVPEAARLDLERNVGLKGGIVGQDRSCAKWKEEIERMLTLWEGRRVKE